MEMKPFKLIFLFTGCILLAILLPPYYYLPIGKNLFVSVEDQAVDERLQSVCGSYAAQHNSYNQLRLNPTAVNAFQAYDAHGFHSISTTLSSVEQSGIILRRVQLSTGVQWVFFDRSENMLLASEKLSNEDADNVNVANSNLQWFGVNTSTSGSPDTVGLHMSCRRNPRPSHAWFRNAASPIVREASQKPVTATVIVICGAAWLYVYNYRIMSNSIALQYDAVVNGHEFWRILTCAFSHIEPIHLLMNLATTTSISDLEIHYGSAHYAEIILYLVVLTSLISLALTKYASRWYRTTQPQHTWTLGFSAVLFALVVDICAISGRYCLHPMLPCIPTWYLSVGPFQVAFNFAPFLLLGLIHIFLPKSSFTGHLAGIFVGICLSWGWFHLLTPATFLYSFSVIVTFIRGKGTIQSLRDLDKQSSTFLLAFLLLVAIKLSVLRMDVPLVVKGIASVTSLLVIALKSGLCLCNGMRSIEWHSWIVALASDIIEQAWYLGSLSIFRSLIMPTLPLESTTVSAMLLNKAFVLVSTMASYAVVCYGIACMHVEVRGLPTSNKDTSSSRVFIRAGRIVRE